MNKLEKAIKEVKELREHDEKYYRKELEKGSKGNVGMFWSGDGMKFYIVLTGEVVEFSLPIPFSRDFRLATYVGIQKLI